MSHPPIRASRKLSAPPESVFGYLEDLANHVSLAPHSAKVLSLGPGDQGLGQAVVRLRGPFGLRRTATTEIIHAEPPRFIEGRARVGSRTRACVTWRIAADEGGSDVSLCAAIESAGHLEALVLRLGGRRWIAGRFAAALDALALRLEEAPHPHAAPSATGQLRRAGATP